MYFIKLRVKKKEDKKESDVNILRKNRVDLEEKC